MGSRRGGASVGVVVGKYVPNICICIFIYQSYYLNLYSYLPFFVNLNTYIFVFGLFFDINII